MQKCLRKVIIRTMYGRHKQDDPGEARKEMVRKDLQGRDIRDPGVLKVMGELAREEFVPGKYRSQAYSD